MKISIKLRVLESGCSSVATNTGEREEVRVHRGADGGETVGWGQQRGAGGAIVGGCVIRGGVFNL